MTEYRWHWGKPEHPGVWAWGGVNRADSKFSSALHITNHSVSANGWWCFLMDLPTILPPKKKTVWRMWVVALPDCDKNFWALWVQDRDTPQREDAIRTDKTEERDE